MLRTKALSLGKRGRQEIEENNQGGAFNEKPKSGEEVMYDEEIEAANRAQSLLAPLWDDLKGGFPDKRPLLAHYTSITVLEKILRTDEVWFSNPLVMNDLQEVRFGITQGNNLVLNRLNNQDFIDAFGGRERVKRFQDAYIHNTMVFQNQDVFDLYMLCTSEHDDEKHHDGLLSMWRGYGGNGMGAAIVLDTSRIQSFKDSPLIIAPVKYGSDEDRVKWLSALVDKFIPIVKNGNFPDNRLYLPAYFLNERIKIMAVLSKHSGFAEEREWRIVYWKGNDKENKLGHMFSYFIGPRGIEPKLKFKIGPISGIVEEQLTVEKLTYKIILGPSVSSPFAKAGITRMLDQIGKGTLKERITASTIPYRPNF